MTYAPDLQNKINELGLTKDNWLYLPIKNETFTKCAAVQKMWNTANCLIITYKSYFIKIPKGSTTD
ncbi:MAG: hypothetical protein ABS44_09210 [Chryseobacterium sp. SCN 40-13]|nr:MAG: hypothetical protein ABS44_09210 [Chryseobacterium sp. SCN 40-13]